MADYQVKHEVHIKPESEDEEFFIKCIIPMCVNRVGCRLGVIFGRDYNTYVITQEDYDKVKRYLK